jgi:hypothetical protein
VFPFFFFCLMIPLACATLICADLLLAINAKDFSDAVHTATFDGS